MADFGRTTANVAAWNLSGFHPIPDDRLERQVDGLALLDAEVVALVEINPLSAIATLKQGLQDKGVNYDYTILEQERGWGRSLVYKLTGT